MTRRFAVPAVHAAWGGALISRPLPLLATLSGRPPKRRDMVVLRVLGARHLAQAALTAAAPAPAVLAAGAVVDVLHATTCLGAAVMSIRWRRAARLGCLSAAGLAATGLVVAQRAHQRRPGTPRPSRQRPGRQRPGRHRADHKQAGRHQQAPAYAGTQHANGQDPGDH